MDEQHALERSERKHDPTRLLTVSDGVFAIILTLLVLELKVPELANGQGLREALREVRPSFVAFLISFFVVAMAWVGHRDVFTRIRRTDRVLIWLNLLLLLPLSILPFGASLLSRYDREPTALELYGFILIAIALTRLTMWVYVVRRPYLLFEPVDMVTRWLGAVVIIVPGFAYAIAIALSTSAPTVSLAIYALAPVAYFVSMTWARSIEMPRFEDRDST
jgi:uncharacterized membrane protein